MRTTATALKRIRGSERWCPTPRVGDLLLRAADENPGQRAVVFPEFEVTYGELEERAFQVARLLLGRGLGPGSHIGVLMPNCREFVELLFGATLIGAIFVPINSRFAPRELGYVIENGDLDILFTSDAIVEHVDFVDILQRALPGLAERPPGAAPELPSAPALKTIVLFGDRQMPGMISQDEFEDEPGSVDDRDVLERHQRTLVRGLAMMIYTSGTTAMPKGCLLSHEALVRPAMGFGRTRYFLDRESRFWDPLPMFHSAAIVPLLATFDAGGTFLAMKHFEAGTALEMIAKEQPTVIYPSFPAVTQALLNHPDYNPDLFRDVKLALNVATPDMLRDMQSRMPHTIQLSCYGLTECGGPICINEPTDTVEQRCTTSGTPIEGMEIEIRDIETGMPLGPGERGEIVVRGHGVFSGYHKDPEKTAESLEPSGWCHTGDLGDIDDTGRVRYLGRTKDMLKVGGENVAALEIESQIATHPAVALVAVVGVPDPKYIEVPAAFIELRPGHELDEDELLQHCRDGLARFKVPQHVRFVTEWPTSATKIQKIKLQEQLATEISNQPSRTT